MDDSFAVVNELKLQELGSTKAKHGQAWYFHLLDEGHPRYIRMMSLHGLVSCLGSIGSRALFKDFSVHFRCREASNAVEELGAPRHRAIGMSIARPDVTKSERASW